MDLNDLGTKNVLITVNAEDLMRFFEKVSNRAEVQPEEKLLTTEEACKLARVSRPTLHRWKSNGIIPFIKIGKNIRYKESDLKKLLESKSM